MNDSSLVACEGKHGRETAFFPKILPDELIVSAVSRYSFISQQDRRAINKKLFANACKHIAYDLPLGMNSLAKSVESLDPKQLIMKHTLYPFFVVLFDDKKREAVMNAMLKDGTVHNKVFGRLSLVPRPEFLRYCELCDVENEKRFGTRYWQRVHQLPTSLACVQHHVPLYASTVSTSPGGVKYHPLTSAVANGSPLLPEMGGSSIERFVHLARVGQELLNWGGRTKPDFPSSLRELALDAGFRSNQGYGKVALTALSKEFHKDSFDLLNVWSWLKKRAVNKANPNWISIHTVQERGRSTVAFTYAVLRSYLELKIQGYHFSTQEFDWSDVHFDRSSVARRRQLEELPMTSLETLIATAIDQILGEVPLVRVSGMEICRRSPEIAHAWRIDLGGIFRSTLKERSETVEEFHLRLARFAVREAAKDDRRLPLYALARYIGDRTPEKLKALRAEAERLETLP